MYQNKTIINFFVTIVFLLSSFNFNILLVNAQATSSPPTIVSISEELKQNTNENETASSSASTTNEEKEKSDDEKKEEDEKNNNNNATSSSNILNTKTATSTILIQATSTPLTLATSTIEDIQQSTSTTFLTDPKQATSSSQTSTSTPPKSRALPQIGIMSLAIPLEQTAPLGTLLFPETPDWNIEIATHLAKRALLDPTEQDIEDLFNQGSKQAAVDLLFEEPTQSELQDFQTALADFAQRNNENLNSSSYMEKLYLFTLMNDPFRAKRKLWLLWEDTFSVEAPVNSKNITYSDVKNLHDFLYDNALGDYRFLAKSMLTNYAMGMYLDLFNAKIDSPNENFARELMQLFLMEEYLPLDNQTKNYTEDDVKALSFILTGFRVNEGTKTPYYDSNFHNTEQQMFLGELKNDPATIVNYIFQKRSNEIAQFIGAKLLRYYVRDNYTQSELNQVASEFINNNFNIEATIKWLLASNIFYSSEAMNNVKYKTPMDIVTGTYALFYQNMSETVEPTSYWLRSVGFTPYKPGSIFGRDGFEENSKWFNSYTTNAWVSLAARLAYERPSIPEPWNVSNLVPWLASSTEAATKTPLNLIEDMENVLLLGEELSTNVKGQLETYLTTDEDGNTINFDPANTDYQNSHVKGLISLILTQPEYLLLSGAKNLTQANINSSPSELANKPKIVFVRLNGGYDYMGLVAPISDPSYFTFRADLALQTNERIDLGGGYALNNAAQDFFPFYSSGELTFINSVGLPGHSRSHSRALEQMETGLLMVEGAVAKYFKNKISNSSDLIALYNGTPHLFKGAEHLNIGSQSMQFRNTALSSADLRNYNFNTLKNIINSRNYPENIAKNFVDAAKLNDVSISNINDGGNGGAGGNNESQFRFIQSLLDNNLGSVYYLRGNGGYDTHSNQETNYNNRIGTLASDIRTFYETAKTNGHEVTVVVYSEFGRTNRMNGNMGTDHGTGGGMVVLSNVFDWPNMVGTMQPSLDQRNWLTPRVDTRAVWASILGEHFGATPFELFETSLVIEDYYSNTVPNITKLRPEYINANNARFSFEVKDGNFDTSNTGLSSITINYGANQNNLNQLASFNQTFSDRVIINFTGLTPDTEYFYQINMTDNLGNSSPNINGSFTTVETKNQNAIFRAGMNNKSCKINGINQNVLGEVDIAPIVLNATSTAGFFENGIRVEFATSTSIVKLINNSSEQKNWTGTLLAPITYNAQSFLAENDQITVGERTITRNNLLSIFKIGADVPGISLEFDKNVNLKVPVNTQATSTNVFYSHDGVSWYLLETGIPIINGQINFNTNHFTFFIVTPSSVTNTNDDDNNNNDNNDSGDDNNDNTNDNNNSVNLSNVSGGGSLPMSAYAAPQKPYSVTVIDTKTNKNFQDITLMLEAGDNITDMSISFSPDFKDASLIPFEEIYKIQSLDAKDKIVYVKFYTAFGKTSEIVSAQIETTSDDKPAVLGIMHEEPIQKKLIRTSKIYVIKNGEKHCIKNLEELKKYNSKKIHNVSNSELKQYANPGKGDGVNYGSYKDGELIKGSWVYHIQNNKLKYIKNLNELKKYTGIPIYDISFAEFYQY